MTDDDLRALAISRYEFWPHDETLSVLAAAQGKVLASVSLDLGDYGQPDHLAFRFGDGGGFRIYDFCNYRAMTTDDDLSAFAGATFLGAEVRKGPIYDDDDEVHEIAFLVVSTSLGEFTVETHNWHNGYYGGFSIKACPLDCDTQI